MTIFLKQSTASQEVPLGRFVDSTDGNTEETGLSIANTDIKIWKCGATTLASKNSGGATHIANGVYYCVLDATDTDTLGSLVIHIHVAGALPIKVECVVLAANVYDSLIGGGDVLDVSVTQFGGSNITQSGGRPEVNTTLIEGSDATNQIRDSVVDDATRIDASALNTLSGHDPGETIMGATDLGTGAGLTSLASASNLAAIAALIGVSSDSPALTLFEKLESGAAGISTSDILAMTFEGSETFQDFLRLVRAVVYGKATGLDGTTPAFRNLADDADRVASSISTGTRTNTLDPDS